MRPLGIPVCGRRIRQEFPCQPEQGALQFFRLELMTSIIELLAELPGLRTQPKGAGLATRAEECAPLTRVLEQLEQNGTSLHTSSKASLANRSRTSSVRASRSLSMSPGSLPEGEGGVFIPSCTRARLHALYASLGYCPFLCGSRAPSRRALPGAHP